MAEDKKRQQAEIFCRKLDILALRAQLTYHLGRRALDDKEGFTIIEMALGEDRAADICDGPFLQPDVAVIQMAEALGIRESVLRKSLRAFPDANVSADKILKTIEILDGLEATISAMNSDELIQKHTKKGAEGFAPGDVMLVPITISDHSNFPEDSWGHINNLAGIVGPLTADAMTHADSDLTDTPLGVMLMYRGIPQCKAAFQVTGQSEVPDTVLITEMQGINLKYPLHGDGEPAEYDIRHPEALRRLNWRRICMDVAQEIARRYDIPTTGVVAAENNRWLQGDDKLILSGKRAYDTPADKYGYTRGPDGNYYKPVRD